MIHVLITMGRLYRAVPFRRHCSVSEGRHVWLCRAMGLPSGPTIPGIGTGYGRVGTAMMGKLGSTHFS